MADKSRNLTLPDDFDDEYEFLKYARDLYREDVEYDHENREAMIEDLKFMVGDQWDDEIKQLRDDNGKPSLIINHIPAFVGQLVGNRRLNETVINVLPDHGGTKEVAKIRRGIIRNIQKTSHATRAYDMAFQHQVMGGIGNWRLAVEYANDDVFEQDIKVREILDPEAIVWDRRMIDKTGSDATHVFIGDTIPRRDFEKKWPDVQISDFDDDTIGEKLTASTWFTPADVRVVEFWRMRTRTRMLALMTDGDVEDITDAFEGEGDDAALPDELLDRIVTREDGEPIVREVERSYAEMYLLCGSCVLEGPYRLPISRVPVFRAPGWEVVIGDKKHRWGLIRFMKDPMRYANYWRSVIVEKLQQSPKAIYMGPDEAFDGYEDEWRNSHLNNNTLLRYNAEIGVKPERIEPVQLEPALIQAAQMSLEDLQHVTNLRDASLGAVSNEVSGKAIIARQRVGELGTVIYLKNLDEAIEETGRVMNELIPTVYDTPRKVKILGDDEKEALIEVNGQDEGGPDITLGKYSVTSVSGPSTQTKRIEAQESLLTFMNHAPQAAGGIADLIAENMDWPGSDKMAKRLREMNNVMDDEDMTDEQKAQRQAAQKRAAMVENMQLQSAQEELEMKRAQRREALARAEEAEARAAKTASEVGVAATKAATDERKTEADIEKTEAEADYTEARAVNEMMGKQEKKDDRKQSEDE